MSKKTKQGCKTCRFSRFERTEKGNIKRNEAGRCLFRVTLPELPCCVNPIVLLYKGIWPDYGKGCKCYEEKYDGQ